MKWIVYLVFTLLAQPFSCTAQAPIYGKITFAPNDQWAPTLFLIQPRSLDEVASSFLGQVIDSAKVKADGSFVFEKLPDSPEPMLLELAVQKKGEQFVNRLTNENPGSDNYCPFVWKNGLKLKVSASIAQFQSSFSIENPSPENVALLKLRDIRRAAFQQFLSKNKDDEHEEAKLLEVEGAKLNFQKTLMDFAQQNDQLLPALLAIRWVSTNQDYERIPEFLFSQCQKWQSQYPSHPWVAQLCQKCDRKRLPVLIGDKLPDALLPMLAGDTLALAQLVGKRRLTLLDIWASWCAPCRRENRDFLVPLWEQHHKTGFEIIAYALDASPAAWKKAIDADGAYRWVHASHLRGDDAPLMEALRIQTIPANFLLDADGKVIAKNLYGNELINFVAQYLRE
ncbi:MAG: TlpA disulfide reductase family protein [Haliscomenobacter sp.]|uniref:TlpA family protein disulfide reductase n=1 Tax=Haliscomenobacter sp. TaxID=2717303 RepID=UPI0029BF6041|nr:TlpA disulfide reductase family protein [Haliscomenobacter sp.]MDX2070975.1 TlpA disulfide reductase family protein [Haliscomenobacter sp.]